MPSIRSRHWSGPVKFGLVVREQQKDGSKTNRGVRR